MGVYTLNDYKFESINIYNGTRSPSGTVEYDLTTAYFYRCLYQRVLSNLKFRIPETWNKDYFKNVLFGFGFIGIVKTSKFGVIPQICNPYGYGLFLQPTNLRVAQPLVTFDGTIGVDCELIKITPDYLGICDIAEHYANKLSKCWTSIEVSLINSRVGMVALPKSKNASEALKYIVERLSAGEPLVCGDKILKEDLTEGEPLFMTFGEPAKNYITDKLLNDFTTILNSFDREVGIPIIDNKKERMLSDEIPALLGDSSCRIETWKECLNDSIIKVNNLFDLNISFKVRGDEINGKRENDSNGPI
jgi:hypothetical protein